ncbi:MAG: FecCD family ABC transporter permease, partial [Campylobacter upsaliensis]
FGASLVIAFGSFGLPLITAVPIGAFLMTMLAASVLFGFASFKRFDSAMLVLVGISLLFLFQSFLSLVQYLSAPEISQQILFWLFGSLLKSNWTNLPIVSIVTLVCVLLLLRDSWALTALKLGEARAKSMGINLNFLRFKTLVLVSIMTATAISFVGVIGFIGLVSPHIARMLVGEDQRFFLPSAMFVGAAFLSLASVLSKVIIPGALFPVGIITSLIGVPFFFWIIFSRKNYAKA